MRAWLSLALPLVPLMVPLTARAELWGYVDGNGVAHVAPTQVDSRYGLVLSDRSEKAPSERALGELRVPGKTNGAASLLTWLEFAPEVKSLQAVLREAAAAYGVDIELLKAIIAVESGFDASAVSPRGAVGLMQIMPVASGADDKRQVAQRLLDPRTNIMTGARLLSSLIRRFGRIDVALAAWNAGEGTVKKYGGGMPPIPETQAHVHLVLEVYWALLQNNLSHKVRGLQLHSAEAASAAARQEPSKPE